MFARMHLVAQLSLGSLVGGEQDEVDGVGRREGLLRQVWSMAVAH